MTRHTISTELEVTFVPARLTESETEYPKIEITYNFTAGDPGSGPSYSSGGEPPTGAELEVVSVKVVDACGITMGSKWWEEKAQEWLDNDGYERACDEAETDNIPDPDAKYEASRD